MHRTENKCYHCLKVRHVAEHDYLIFMECLQGTLMLLQPWLCAWHVGAEWWEEAPEQCQVISTSWPLWWYRMLISSRPSWEQGERESHLAEGAPCSPLVTGACGAQGLLPTLSPSVHHPLLLQVCLQGLAFDNKTEWTDQCWWCRPDIMDTIALKMISVHVCANISGLILLV